MTFFTGKIIAALMALGSVLLVGWLLLSNQHKAGADHMLVTITNATHQMEKQNANVAKTLHNTVDNTDATAIARELCQQSPECSRTGLEVTAPADTAEPEPVQRQADPEVSLVPQQATGIRTNWDTAEADDVRRERIAECETLAKVLGEEYVCGSGPSASTLYRTYVPTETELGAEFRYQLESDGQIPSLFIPDE